jgi:hypothetical protein
LQGLGEVQRWMGFYVLIFRFPTELIGC